MTPLFTVPEWLTDLLALGGSCLAGYHLGFINGRIEERRRQRRGRVSSPCLPLLARRVVVVPPGCHAVPGLPTLASARALLRTATARARNRRQPRQQSKPQRKEGR